MPGPPPRKLGPLFYFFLGMLHPPHPPPPGGTALVSAPPPGSWFQLLNHNQILICCTAQIIPKCITIIVLQICHQIQYVSSPSSSNNRPSSSEKSFSSVFWSGEFVQSQPEQRPVHFYSRLFNRHNVLVNIQTYKHSNVFQISIRSCRLPSDIDLPFVYFPTKLAD